MKKFNSFLFFVGCIAASIFITFRYFTNDIRSADDLAKITGKLSYYSAEKTPRRRIGSRDEYRIKLENYHSYFRIYNTAAFDKDNFKRKVRPGDLVIMTIPKSEVDNLNISEDIKVTSIKVGSTTYLDASTVIKSANDPKQLIYSVLFLIAAYLFYRFKGRNWS